MPGRAGVGTVGAGGGWAGPVSALGKAAAGDEEVSVAPVVDEAEPGDWAAGDGGPKESVTREWPSPA